MAVLLLAVLAACGGPKVEPPSEAPATAQPAAPAAPAEPAAPADPAPLEARSVVAGCLEDGGGEDGGSTRAAGPAISKPPRFVVEGSAGAVHAVQEFSHACCLSGAVSEALDGDVLTVTTKLSGEPCRCYCRSTVTSDVTLDPGRYTVRLVQDQGEPVVLHESAVDVR